MQRIHQSSMNERHCPKKILRTGLPVLRWKLSPVHVILAHVCSFKLSLHIAKSIHPSEASLKCRNNLGCDLHEFRCLGRYRQLTIPFILPLVELQLPKPSKNHLAIMDKQSCRNSGPTTPSNLQPCNMARHSICHVIFPLKSHRAKAAMPAVPPDSSIGGQVPP